MFMINEAEPPFAEQTRERLRELGIPDEKHTIEYLSGLYPPEFDIARARLDPHSLASVLIHLVRRGLIRLPGE